MISGAGTIEHGDSATGRWLRARRVRIALWAAAIEGVLVAVAPGVSRWTIAFVAVLAIALYGFAGRNARWDLGHQVSWILAASQALAVVVVILAAMVFWTALLLVGVFAAIALVILFTDR